MDARVTRLRRGPGMTAVQEATPESNTNRDALLNLHAGGLDHLAPLHALGAGEGGKGFGAFGQRRIGTGALKLLLHLRQRPDAPRFGGKLVDDWLRRAGRRAQALPGGGLETPYTLGN